MEYVSVNTVIANLYRDFRHTEFNETDLIGWAGEAMEQMTIADNLEQAVAFVEVKDHHADMPYCLSQILQIARNQQYSKECKDDYCPSKIIHECNTAADICHTNKCETLYKDSHPANQLGYPVPLDCNGTPLLDYEVAYFRPYFDLDWDYHPLTQNTYYRQNFTPVRLADHTFFNNVVCQENDHNEIYESCQDEYSIVGYDGDRKLRFSFKEGQVAIAYLRSAIDKETGYPLIPDNISFKTAIRYYILWKRAETDFFNNREGSSPQLQYAQQQWLKYVKQAKNFSKMPKSLDDYQDLLEQTHRLIPRLQRYYGFFGNLNTRENRHFNNPDDNRRYYR